MLAHITFDTYKCDSKFFYVCLCNILAPNVFCFPTTSKQHIYIYSSVHTSFYLF